MNNTFVPCKSASLNEAHCSSPTRNKHIAESRCGVHDRMALLKQARPIAQRYKGPDIAMGMASVSCLLYILDNIAFIPPFYSFSYTLFVIYETCETRGRLEFWTSLSTERLSVSLCDTVTLANMSHAWYYLLGRSWSNTNLL